MTKPSLKAHVLLTQPVPTPIDAKLTQDYHVHRLYEAPDTEVFMAEIGHRIEAVVTGGAKGVSRALMDRLPRLRIIAISGIGTDAIDLVRAAERNIHVTTTPDVLTDDVADMAFGLILSTLRRLGEGDRLVRDGLWGKVNQPLARKVSGIDMGIIGLGRVGHAIARRARAFDMTVFYNSRREQPDSGYTFVSDVEALARRVNVLVVAASADEGQVIVNGQVLAALGADGYLINVARGKLVDEQALVEALQERRIAGAGLDVFADEPNVPAALLDMPQVTLQPHRASATVETRLQMGQLVLDNLAACLRGEDPPHRVKAG